MMAEEDERTTDGGGVMRGRRHGCYFQMDEHSHQISSSARVSN